jgi:ribose transport system permease protein
MSTLSSSSDAAPVGQGADHAPRRRRTSLDLAERFGLLALLVLVVVLFCAIKPDTFATAQNFQNIAISQSVLAIAALALALPLVGGRFDVSVGNNMGLCAIAAAGMMSKNGIPLVPTIILTTAIGSLVGLVNGLIVAYLGVNSIIATIGTGTIMGGLVQAYTKGIPISDGLSSTLTDLNASRVLGIPYMFIIMLFISAVVWFLLTQTPYGRKLLAVGSNQNSAILTGLDVHRLVMLSFVGTGALAGIAGVLQVSAQGSGDPTAGSLTFILPALAAVFLGATTWQPGRYNVPGTLIGLFFVGTTISGLVLVGVQPWVTDVFNGAAVVVAIVISAQLRRRRTGTNEVGT